MLPALLAACPGNHLHLPDLASQALAGRHKGQEVMTTPKILGRVSGSRAQRISGSPARLRMLLALPAAAAAAAALAACSSAGASPSSPASSSSGPAVRSPAAATAGTVKTTQIGGATVLTSSKGFTLYSFAPDTPTTSKCTGTCAQNWPPVQGPVTAAGVTGTFGTIKRSDGLTQAIFDGHPLYTFVGDTAPGQNKGNGLNAAGGLWHEITTSGTAPAGNSSSSSGGGGYGY
jgi:predicted lipoprotein with Yx(FWY)xxD motif